MGGLELVCDVDRNPVQKLRTCLNFSLEIFTVFAVELGNKLKAIVVLRQIDFLG